MPTFLQQVKQTAQATFTPQNNGPSFDDDQCCNVSVYFFQLDLPRNRVASSSGTFYVPLVLNPQSMVLSEPFAMEATMTQGSGLYIERNGIVQRTLQIQGTTGWELQPWRGESEQLSYKTPNIPENWNRVLAKAVPTGTPLSGQKHFQYLQDAVFRVYSQFSKDQATTADTSLVFHNPRDRESWRVEPRSFQMNRNAKNPLCYDYAIDLLIVGHGDSVKAVASPDKNVIDKLHDTLLLVAQNIAIGRAYVNQLSNAAYALRQVVTDIDSILYKASSVIAAAANFVAGVTELIESPYSLVTGLCQNIDEMAALIHNLVNVGKDFPEIHRQAVFRLQASLMNLALHPEIYQDGRGVAAKIKLALQNYENTEYVAALAAAKAANDAALAAAAAANAPAPTVSTAKLGTGLLPADVVYATVLQDAAPAYIEYTGAHPYQVVTGDTLANLASRYLGDAKLWVYIAAANDMSPPYSQAQASAPLVANLSQGALSGLALGATIYIPDFSTPVPSQSNGAVLGALQTDPADVQAFGRDLAIATSATQLGVARTEHSDDLLDLQIDTVNGGTDLAVVAGAPNLTQGVITRLATEIGTDTLFPANGIAPIVATNIQGVDNQTALLIVRTAMIADPRVASVEGLTLQQGTSLDTVAIEGVLQAANGAASVPLSISLT